MKSFERHDEFLMELLCKISVDIVSLIHQVLTKYFYVFLFVCLFGSLLILFWTWFYDWMTNSYEYISSIFPINDFKELRFVLIVQIRAFIFWLTEFPQFVKHSPGEAWTGMVVFRWLLLLPTLPPLYHLTNDAY